MAETGTPEHADGTVMVEVPAQLIAALYQAVDHAGGGKPPSAGVAIDSPAQAIALLYQTASHSTGLELQNAVHSQQALNQIGAAVVSKAVQLIMAIGETGGTASLAATGPATSKAPAALAGNAYQSMAHSTGILFENSVAAQQQQNSLQQAAANQGVMQIYSLDTTAAAGATENPKASDEPKAR